MTGRSVSVVALLQTASRRVNSVCWFVAGVILVAMLAAVLLQVAGRYLFFSPPSWTEEFARYCMVWAGLLGATVTYHERTDPVLAAARPVRSRVLAILAEIIRSMSVLAVVLPILIYSPAVVDHHMLRLTESMRWTSGYVLLVVPLFSALILFHLVVRVVSVCCEGGQAIDSNTNQ